MSGSTPDREEDQALAAEYVLGLLAPAEQRAFEARLSSEPDLRRAVAAWAEDFAALTDDIAEVPPPRGVEAQIRRRLFPAERRSGGRLGRLWPWLLGAVAAAAVAFVAVDRGLLGRSGEPELLARIASQDETLVVEARFDADTRRLEVQRVAGEIPEGRDLELWLVRTDQGATTTVSLGVIPRERDGVIEVSADLAAEFPDNALALSVEPLGGSPTGQATGPVVALGELTGL